MDWKMPTVTARLLVQSCIRCNADSSLTTGMPACLLRYRLPGGARAAGGRWSRTSPFHNLRDTSTTEWRREESTVHQFSGVTGQSIAEIDAFLKRPHLADDQMISEGLVRRTKGPPADRLLRTACRR